MDKKDLTFQSSCLIQIEVFYLQTPAFINVLKMCTVFRWYALSLFISTKVGIISLPFSRLWLSNISQHVIQCVLFLAFSPFSLEKYVEVEGNLCAREHFNLCLLVFINVLLISISINAHQKSCEKGRAHEVSLLSNCTCNWCPFGHEPWEVSKALVDYPVITIIQTALSWFSGF